MSLEVRLLYVTCFSMHSHFARCSSCELFFCEIAICVNMLLVCFLKYNVSEWILALSVSAIKS